MLRKASSYLGCLALISIGTEAGILSIAATPAKLGGTWYDRSEIQTVISVVEKDGFIDLLGKDAVTIYSCTGIVEKNRVTCMGSGMNHAIDKRFTYKSQLNLADNDQTLEETWEAVFVGGEKLTGKTSFKRQQPKIK